MEENNNQNTFWEKLMHHKHALFISFFSAILVTAFILLSVYNTDSRFFQGYLKKLSLPAGSGNTELLFDHLHVVNGTGGQIKMPFYINNVSTQYEGIELKFENWPSYLNLSSNGVVKGSGFANWGVMSDAFSGTTPKIFIYSQNTNPNLQNGKIFDLVFNVSGSVPLIPEQVKIKADFITIAQTVSTNQETFMVAPKSDYVVTHPTTIQPTSTIQIPFNITGISATSKLVGGVLTIDSIPGYMVYQGVSTSGSIKDWTNVLVNKDAGSAVTDGIIKVAFTDFRTENPGASSSGLLFTLNLSIPSTALVTIPETPISVQPEFVISTNNYSFYGNKTFIQVGGTTSNMADICYRGPGGDIVHKVGMDGIVGISDLHCMVTEWAKTGNNLSANIYKVPPSQEAVDIRDLTVLLSQYSKEPDIQSISPQEGPVTTQLSITGSDFYASQPSSVVELYLVKKDNPNIKHLLTERSRTNTAITASVPTNVPVGDYKVQIIVGKELSVTRPGFKVK